MNVCKNCKNLFVPRRYKTEQFCGKKCYKAFWYRERNPEPKGTINTCLYCGKEFPSKTRKVEKYCSRYCTVMFAYRTKNPGAGFHVKHCEICGKKFTSRRSDARICGSRKCQWQSIKSNYNSYKERRRIYEKSEGFIRAKKERESTPEYKKKQQKYNQKYWKEYKSKLDYNKKCETCGKVYLATRIDQKYCSGPCRIKPYRQSTKGKLTRLFEFHRRRTDKTNPNALTKSQWKKTVADFNHKCAYCGKRDRLQQDHFIPVKHGGKYTKNNIVPACPSCNRRKNAHLPQKWMVKEFENGKEEYKKIKDYLSNK